MPSQATINERMAAAETGIGQLKAAIQGLADEQRRDAEQTRKSLEELGQKIGDSSRTPWGHIWAAAGAVVGVLGIIITIVGGLLGAVATLLYIPMRDDVRGLRESTVENRRLIEVLRQNQAEIETQFHGKYDTSNLQFQHVLQVLNMVLKQAHLEPIDMPTFWPSSAGGSRAQ